MGKGKGKERSRKVEVVHRFVSGHIYTLRFE